ncbi:alcohol dehydrogenase 7 [Artemisia annua]|uniref:Alcohol dehydrogenase 7 n=1 Tax=Artemisia annua TaxID=35608 RepID=A0A2U1LRW6_ARTAN|nr:alcohol dehydrogenase 7 [Artemisia annua]
MAAVLLSLCNTIAKVVMRLTTLLLHMALALSLGMGTPHVVTTFLALGDITYTLKLGFCMYWHKHGCCSIIFVQHNCEGGDEADDIAPAHGASSVGTHVTAVVTCDPTNNINTIVVAKTVMYGNDFIFQHLTICLLQMFNAKLEG